MTGALALAAITCGFASAMLTHRSELWSRILKMVASTAMIAIVVAGDPEMTGYVIFIMVGLAASWVGDLSLSFSGEKAFLGGLISFALAHVFYTGGFIARSAMDLLSIAVAAIVMAVTSAAIMRWLSPHTPERLSTPVAVYIGIISVMVVTSFGTSGTIPDPRIPTAAVLFMISDVLVARQQFIAPSIWNRIIGLPMYYAAQALFAITAVIPWS